jgi:hypothetical protein
MKTIRLFFSFFIGVLFFSCEKTKEPLQQIVVKNTLDSDRSFETVSIDFTAIKAKGLKGGFTLIDAETKKEVVSQQVDEDGDGIMDAILFQPDIAANSEKIYNIYFSETAAATDSIPACYSRFVPERTDDYAWENNRVAFRTYGPVAQRMVEDGAKGGTLSSGIDAWLKRVDYPIINKWYKKELETDGSYHKDDGEGLDNFHVGISRGVGGVAKKVDTSYYISKNFISWKTLNTGPIRTSFILKYADWDAAGTIISEEKKITLDYGQNLSRFEITLKGTDIISAGLTLHKKEGEIGVSEIEGWLSYWEPHFDSELGTGILVPENEMVGYDHYLTNRKDASNLFAHININKNKAVYYAGFSWKKSGQYTTKSDWEDYLTTFSKHLKSPLEVIVKYQ